MKTIIMYLMLLVSITTAQTMEKGTISFSFEGLSMGNTKPLKMSFTSVSLRKDEHFIVNARAENNTDRQKIFVNLELELYKKWNQNKEDQRLFDSLKSKNLDVPVTLSNVIDLQMLDINTNSYTFMMIRDNVNTVGKYENLNNRALGMPAVYATQKIVCKVTEASVQTENKKIIIKGKFIVMLIGNSGTELLAEIKDGYFEIII